MLYLLNSISFTVVEGGLMSLRQIRSDVSLDMLPDRDSLRDSAEDLNEFIQEKAFFF